MEDLDHGKESDSWSYKHEQPRMDVGRQQNHCEEQRWETAVQIVETMAGQSAETRLR